MNLISDKMDYEEISGLVAAPFAPMDENGCLNTELIEDYRNLLEFNGISGVFINGSTGEGASLTFDEKKKVISAWSAPGDYNSKLKVISLVGGTSLNECIELATFSVEQGVHAIALIAPYYFKPCSIVDLGRFIEKVAGEVPDMPVYFYNIPLLTGVSFRMTELLKFVDGRIPNFSGIKYTCDDLADYFSCINYAGGRYDILWGRDETLLAALTMGAIGAVGSTYNYAAPLYKSMMESFATGNLEKARILQMKSIEMVSLLGKYGGIAGGKAFMRYIGMEFGQPRLPVTSFDASEADSFIADVKALKMDELFSSMSKVKL